MAGRPRKHPRSDTGRKRENYNIKHDKTGKTFKENAALKGFWSDHKVADMMLLSSTELDKVIDEWIEKYQAVQLKRDKFWWYPTMNYDPTPKTKGKKKINTSFNTSFVQKKVI
jgi:hypothetical protein